MDPFLLSNNNGGEHETGDVIGAKKIIGQTRNEVEQSVHMIEGTAKVETRSSTDEYDSELSSGSEVCIREDEISPENYNEEIPECNPFNLLFTSEDENEMNLEYDWDFESRDSSSSKSSEESPSSPEESPIPKNEECGIYDIKEKEEQYLASCEGFNQDGYNKVKLVSYKKFRFSQEDLSNISSQGFFSEHTSSMTSQYKNKRMAHFLKIHSNALVEAIIEESLNEITNIYDQKTDLVEDVENRKLNQIHQEQYLTINPREIMGIKTQPLIKNMTFDKNNNLKSDSNRTILTTITADPIETERINGSNKILDDGLNIDTSDLNGCFLPKINDQERSEGHLETVLPDYEESRQDNLLQSIISREVISLTDESLTDAFSDQDFDRLMSDQLIQDDFLDEEIIVDLKTDEAKVKPNQIEFNDESSVQHPYHGYIDNLLNSVYDDTENEMNLETSETVSSVSNFNTDVSDFQKELTGTVKDMNVESRTNIFVVTKGRQKEITKVDSKTVAIRSVEEGDVQNIVHDIMECVVANEVCHKIEINKSVSCNSILFNNSKLSDVDGSPLICENLNTRDEEDKTKKISETNDKSESYDDVTVSNSLMFNKDTSFKMRENIKEYDRKEIEIIKVNEFYDDMTETNNLLCIGELTNKNETMEAEMIDRNDFQDDIGKCVNSEYNEEITHENIGTDENWDEEKGIAEIKKTNDYHQDMSKYLNSIWPLQKVTKNKTMETFAEKFGGNQANPISSEDDIIEPYNLIYENVTSQNGKVRKDEEWDEKETMEFTDTNENHNNGIEYVNLAFDKYLINKNGNMEVDKENGELGIPEYGVKFIHSEDVIESNFSIHEDISENENSDEQMKELTEPDNDHDVIKYDMLVSDEEPVCENNDAVENVDSVETEDFIPFSNYEQYGAERINPLKIIKDEDEPISNYAVSLKEIMEMEMTDDGNNYLIADELFLEANDEVNSESLPSDNSLENGKESCDSNVLNEEKCIEISDDPTDDPTVLMLTNKKSVLRIPSEDTSSFEFIAQYKSDETMEEDLIVNSKNSEKSICRDQPEKSEEDFLTRSCFLDNDFTFEEIESKNSNSIHVASISSVVDINQRVTPSVNEDVKRVPLRKKAEEQRNLFASESMFQDNTIENSFYANTNEYLKLDKEFISGVYLHKKESLTSLDENSDFDEVKPLIQGIIDEIARDNNEPQIHSENNKIESLNLDKQTNILTDGNLKSSGANQSGNYDPIDMEMIRMNMFQDTNEELFPIDGYLTPGYRLSSDKDNEIIEGNDEITSGSSEEIIKWILDDSSKERNEQEIPSVGRTYLPKITSVDRFSRLLLQDVDNSIEITDEAESFEKSFWDNFDNQNGSTTAILPKSEFTILNSDISKNTDITQDVSTKVEENEIMSADKGTVEKCPKSVPVCRPLKEILAAQINNTNKSTRNLVPEKNSSISQETLLRVSESQLESIYNAIGFILNEIENTIKIAQSELDTTETNNNNHNNNNSPDFNPMWKLDSRTTAENFNCHTVEEYSTNDQTTTMIPLISCNTSSNSFGNLPFGYEFVAKKDQGSKDCADEMDGTGHHLLEDTLQKSNFLETSKLYNDIYKQMIVENQKGTINTNYSEDYDAVGSIKGKGLSLDFDPLLAESISVKLKKTYGSSDLNKHFLNVIKESSKESEIHSYEESAFRTEENNTKMENALNLIKELSDLEFSSQEKTGRKDENSIDINELEEFVSCENFDVIQEADHFETEKSYEYWNDQVNDTFVEGISLKSASDRGNETKESVSLNDGLTVWYSAENLDLSLTVGQSACDNHVAPSTSSSQPSSRKKLKKISSLRRIAQLAIWKSKNHDLALKVPNKNMEEILPEDKVALKSTSKGVTKSSHGDFKTRRRIVSESSLSTAKESNRSSQKRGIALDMSSSVQLVAFENLMMHRHRNMDEGLAQTDNVEFTFDSWRLEAVTHAIYLAAFVMIFAVFDTAVSLYYSLKH